MIDIPRCLRGCIQGPEGPDTQYTGLSGTKRSWLPYHHDIYIDDTILVCQDREQLISQIKTTVDVFESCGFTVNREKSQLIPVQRIEFLGFILDSVSFTIALTKKKWDDIFALVSSILSHSHSKTTIYLLAKIISKIVAVFPSSDHAQLHYRNLDRFKVKCLPLKQK